MRVGQAALLGAALDLLAFKLVPQRARGPLQLGDFVPLPVRAGFQRVDAARGRLQVLRCPLLAGGVAADGTGLLLDALAHPLLVDAQVRQLGPLDLQLGLPFLLALALAGELGLQFPSLVRDRCQALLGEGGLGLKCRAAGLQAAKPAGEHKAEGFAQLFAVRLVALGPFRLALERIRLARDFLKDVVDPLEIQLGVGELQLGELAAGLEARHAGSLLHECPAVQRAGRQELSDAALLDDGVMVRAETGAEEQVLHVAETHGLAIEDVLARAVAEQLAGYRDLARGGARRNLGRAGAAILGEEPL